MMTEIEAAAVGNRVGRYLALQQERAAKKFYGRSHTIGAIGTQHGAAQFELERNGAGRAVFLDEACSQRTARGVDQAAVDYRGLAHDVRRAHNVAFGNKMQRRIRSSAAAAGDLDDGNVGPRGESHASHLDRGMAAPVRGRVDVI